MNNNGCVMIIEEIKLRFADYMDGVRVSMLIDRSVGNNNKGSKRWVNKIISTNQDEWISAVSKLLELQKHLNDPDIRLYACVNDRKMDRAINAFQHTLLDLQDSSKMDFFRRINDRFCSSLMQPQCRNSKLFLIDYDFKEPGRIDKFISDNMIVVRKTYPSKRGWHYITDGFDVRLTRGQGFDVQRDGLLLINWMNNDND